MPNKNNFNMDYRPDSYWKDSDKKEEVEIATISCEYPPGDMVHLFATPSGKRINYQVIDYEGNEDSDCITPKSTTKPLTLSQLIDMFEKSSEVIFGVEGGFIANLNYALGNDVELEDISNHKYVSIESSFYPQLSTWYIKVIEEFCEKTIIEIKQNDGWHMHPELAILGLTKEEKLLIKSEYGTLIDPLYFDKENIIEKEKKLYICLKDISELSKNVWGYESMSDVISKYGHLKNTEDLENIRQIIKKEYKRKLNRFYDKCLEINSRSKDYARLWREQLEYEPAPIGNELLKVMESWYKCGYNDTDVSKETHINFLWHVISGRAQIVKYYLVESSAPISGKILKAIDDILYIPIGTFRYGISSWGRKARQLEDELS